MTATTTMRWNLWLTIRRLGTAAAAAIVLTLSGPVPAEGAVTTLSTGSFKFELEIQVPGSPGAVFDLFTGDVSPWWDHHFKQKPKKLYIEPKPGGGFYEIFDDKGNGVLHATVIFAERGKSLRLRGPLGFSGHPLDLVCSLEFEALEAGGTRVSLIVRGLGEVQEGWADAVEQVWRHFLIEQFKPYVEKKMKN